MSEKCGRQPFDSGYTDDRGNVHRQFLAQRAFYRLLLNPPRNSRADACVDPGGQTSI